MASDEPSNGERWVTHRRLSEVMDAHRNAEEPAIISRIEARIDRRASVERVERLERDVMTNRERIDEHEELLQQMRGMAGLAKVALGASVLQAIALVVAIVVALR